MIPSTVSADRARDTIWDAIVVGAGPAGTVAAMGVARQGMRTLLIDRAEFPRDKVCGACLNNDALNGLRAVGVDDALDRLDGVPISSFQIGAGSRRLTLDLPGGLAVSRRRMDAMLVEQAIEAGAELLSGVNVRVEQQVGGEAFRQLADAGNDRGDGYKAKAIVVASGLATERRVDDPDLEVVASRNARIGVGTHTSTFPVEYDQGTIFMAVGRHGYVGLTRTDGEQLNIAAALDRDSVRRSSPAEVCRMVLESARFAVSDGMLDGEWRGTVGLTRRRSRVASERLFVIGDAAGYVEPFTGEGMAWAIRGARAVVPVVADAVRSWDPELAQRWAAASRSLITEHQGWCRAFAKVLRHPLLVRGLLQIVGTMPSLGRAVVRRINDEAGAVSARVTSMTTQPL